MIVELVLTLIFVLAVLNLWMTWRVMNDGLATLPQRMAQTALIWLLPVLGALIILRLQRSHPEPHSGRYPANPDPGDDFAVSGAENRMVGRAIEGPIDPPAGND